MKSDYSIRNITIEKGDLGDVDLPFEIREVEKKEIQEFSHKDIKKGILSCIEHSLQEGNHYFRGIDKNTGELLFIFGLCKESKMNLGVPWFLTSKNFKPPIDFIRSSPKVISDMFPEDVKVLVNYIHKDNTKSIKWLAWLGFKFTEHPFLEDYLQFFKHKVV